MGLGRDRRIWQIPEVPSYLIAFCYRWIIDSSYRGNPLRPTRIGVNPDKVWFQGSSRGAETYKATPALRYGSCDRRDETQALALLAPNVMACMEDLTSHRQVGTNSGRLGVSFGGGVAYRVAILAYCNAS